MRTIGAEGITSCIARNPEQRRPNRRAAVLRTKRSDPATAPPKRLVLVVEDDEDVREALVVLLEHEGYAVAAAPHGRAALDLMRHGIMPGVIVLDLMMPVMSGWEFRRHQLADPALAPVPVIVVSADPRASTLGESPGVRDVLAKPTDVEALLRCVAAICTT